eukprot:417890_1
MSPLSITLLILISLVSSYLPSSEIAALRDFYYSLNGEDWTLCSWNITQLAINDTLPSYYCGLKMHSLSNNTQTVYEIYFVLNNNLIGTIPGSIDLLSNLEHIEIMYNILSGTIPQALCNLPKLSWLEFYETDLSGSVPKCIGNLSLTYLELDLSPSLSISDHVIELLCLNAKNLTVLELYDVNYSGSIPECVGNELSELEWIEFSVLPYLHSKIPDSFGNLKKIKNLVFIDLPNLYGIFPPEILKNNNLIGLYIMDTSLSSNISATDLCSNINLTYLDWQFNIPPCIKRLTKLEVLEVAGSSIYGTFPSEICFLHNLLVFSIFNTSMRGTIPKCVGQNLTNLSVLHLSSNQFYGEMPRIFAYSLKTIDVHSNRFDGSVSSIFALHEYPLLEVVVLHSNNFKDNNIETLLEKLFVYSKNLQAITIYGNQISGIFPVFESDTYLKNFSVLAAHQLNIGGVIGNNIHFGNDNLNFVLSIYDNKLSSYLPSNLIYSNSTTPIVLTGNLFTIDNANTLPNWMKKSKFVDAEQLYLSNIDFIKSWIVLLVSIICYIFVCVKKMYHFSWMRHIDIEFVQSIQKIDEYLIDYKLLIIIFILCLFYPFCCSYYSSTPVFSLF